MVSPTKPDVADKDVILGAAHESPAVGLTGAST